MVLGAYDVWLFDLDGTLVDADWSYTREVFDRVGARLGRQFTDREAEVIWHGLNGPRDPQLRAWGIDPAEFWPVFHDEEDPLARAGVTYLHDDAAALVRDIQRRGTPIGVVTHCQQFLADPVLDHLDIHDWFDTVVCCTDEVGWKPDPAPIRHALAQLDVADGECGVVAGDGASDIGAAWNAGLEGIHVERHDPIRRGHCVLADHRVASFDELARDDPDADAGVEDGRDTAGAESVGTTGNRGRR